jgi:hypothetical protein
MLSTDEARSSKPRLELRPCKPGFAKLPRTGLLTHDTN